MELELYLINISMSEFDKTANDILRGLNENFINSASDAIQHRWAKTIAHPGLGEEDEEFLVVDHSLTADGVVEEYYVDYKDELISVPADEATIIVAEGHGDEEEPADDEEDHKETKKQKKFGGNKGDRPRRFDKKTGRKSEERDFGGKHGDHPEEDEEELNSIREAYGLPKKRKGPHGTRPKLNCRSVHSL